MKLFRLFALSCLLAVLFTSGCKSKGSEFVGKWIATDSKADAKPMEIARNGDSYLLTADDGTKLPAELDKDSGILKAANGIMSLTYVQKSDTLLAAGPLGTTQEFKRSK